ncbi:glycosyltransferase family 2 protein [Mycoplasma todarodis]|uniref:Glycosyltransferase 2-like domain-containing protein n=1 Tax=Mycoplasma todarodis TaxID=1937191 RepID=A0A4R0XMS0_9MOLU|nr:glycosyltransferase family 2 protein [Mycoplasma todarodis]TCG11838.1 hypothetical protein C4B25_00775 [Mycoplasma todarodis]
MNQIKNKLSIIISVYNISRWIGECIESVKPLADKEGIEIIIVNDGSTDNSVEIIKENIEGTRIKLLNKTNGGLSDARNFGAAKSSGDFIWFVDGDDFIKPEKIDLLLDNLKKDRDIIHFKFEKIDDRTKEISKNTGWINKNNIDEKEDRDFFKKNGMETTPWTKIFNRRIFQKNSWPSIVHEDEFFLSKLFMDDNLNIYFVNDFFYRYRINREGSIIAQTTNTKKQQQYINNVFDFFEGLNYDDPYFIAGIYIISTKLHLLTKVQYKKFKSWIGLVINSEQFKNYFNKNKVFKIARLFLKLKLFWVFKQMLKLKK